MKKVITTILAVICLTTISMAQQKNAESIQAHRGKGLHHHLHQKMMKELNLTDAQKEQVKANYKEFKKQRIELNKNESITVKEQRDRKEALLKDQKAKMDAILTPEQKAKREEFKKQYKDLKNAKDVAHLQKMKTKLNLTDAQVQQITAQKQKINTEKEAIKTNENLSRTERKEKMENLKSMAKADYKKILTTEQLKQLEEMKKNKQNKNQQNKG